MSIFKKILGAAAVTLLLTSSVAAQDVPPAGPSGGQVAMFSSMPLGTYVIVGGVIFIVTGVGLVAANQDDETTPQPMPSPSTSTASTGP